MEDFWKSQTAANKVKLIFSAILLIVVVVFAVLNWNSQEIHLLFTKKQIPLSLLIIFSVFAGYIISYLFTYRKTKGFERKIEELEEENRNLKSEIIGLRNQ